MSQTRSYELSALSNLYTQTSLSTMSVPVLHKEMKTYRVGNLPPKARSVQNSNTDIMLESPLAYGQSQWYKSTHQSLVNLIKNKNQSQKHNYLKPSELRCLTKGANSPLPPSLSLTHNICNKWK